MREPASTAAAPLAAAGASAALSRNAFFLVVGQAGTTALSVVLSAALARSLGAVDFGVFYLVTTMTTFAYGVVEWGQNLYVTRQVAREPARAGELLGSAIAFRAVAAAAVAGPALLLAWALGYPRSTIGPYAILLGTYLPVSVVLAHGVVFRGRERMELDALLTVGTKALALAATLAVLALGARVRGVLLAQGLAAASAAALALALFRAVRLPRIRVAAGTLRELLAGGAPVVALNVAILAQPYLDAIVVSKLAPPVVMGWYGAAKTFMGALVTPAAILASAAYPRLSRTASDPEAFRGELGTALRPLLWIGAGAASATWLLADVAVGAVYGHAGFRPAVAALQLFAPALLLFFVDILLGHACVAAGRAHAFAVAKAASVVASTALDVVLVPLMQARTGNGVLGVVLAFAGSELIMIAAAIALLPRGALHGGVLRDAGRAALAAAGGPLLLALGPPLGPAARTALGAAAFLVLSAAVGLVRRDDLARLRDGLRGGGRAARGGGP
ncbi:MAG TPA: oligosaccharide flippase family protein [Anaeromyxobacter sp.]|nr:oligosaccharide flippase family protein [Anaeromyxobacter sp.]